MDAVLSEHSYRGGRIVEGRLMFELSNHYMKRARETLGAGAVLFVYCASKFEPGNGCIFLRCAEGENTYFKFKEGKRCPNISIPKVNWRILCSRC